MENVSHSYSNKKPLSTKRLVSLLKETESDFEFYPTTAEMLTIIKEDIHSLFDSNSLSVLDCGAGDGRALMALTEGDRYAIEKSKPLIQQMDRSICVVGTDFHQNTLIDKKSTILYANPPYKEVFAWMNKIILEANAEVIYLVVPVRWRDSEVINESIKRRDAECVSLGNYDFLNAERAARAKVEILRIRLGYKSSHRSGPRVDPFDIWFESNFSIEIAKSDSSRFDWKKSAKEATREALKGKLVEGHDLVSVLENLYQKELESLLKNYKALESIDRGILRELDVNMESLKAALRQKIEGLKDRFWDELFTSLDKITSRLTTDTRKMMLDRMSSHTHVDFTASNAYAVVIWVLKNANFYLDDQLIKLVERMTEKANIRLYKSNQNTYGEEAWRYTRTPKELNRYALDYRIVLHRIGGLSNSQWQYDRNQHNGLTERAFYFLGDILTIANNLGFLCADMEKVRDFQWESNKAVTFHYYDHRKKCTAVLMTVRAFLNQNLHLKLNQAFVARLNIEMGRLKGWLKDHSEAVEELGVTPEEAMAAFGCNLQIGDSDFPQLGFSEAA